ncbi:MAG: hypothetical protein KC435_00280 [Thermomicrobiales bacterium]|nr:hypothetical protein [Thermomicrobiales bacterium]
MRLLVKWLPMVVGLVMLMGILPTPIAAQESTDSLEQQLADKYAPIMYLRTQDHQCGKPPTEGEPYLPIPVDMILNNDRILVRDANTNEVVATGPSAQELATLGADTYLDFPGNPLRPGCTYETDERAWIAEQGIEPSVYAHIKIDKENNKLVLQYWFYYYFNHWNNTHESDWEGILFMWDDVSTVEEALNTDPTQVGYSQHGNGELADWGDSKLTLEDGSHPAAYPAAGSHATFYGNHTYLAWGERNSGFGCDMASPPSTRTPVKAILIPDEIDPKGEFAWLLYPGRWGEQQPSAFNGPVGPYFNTRYLDPWTATSNWRPFSIVVPGSDALGPSMTDAFCTLTAASSRLLLNALVHPLITLPLVGIIVAAIAYFARGAWPIFQRAVAMYKREWKLFIGIGLMSIPIGIIFNGIQQFLIRHDPLKFIVNYLDNTGGAALTAVFMVGGIQQLAMVLVISPAILVAAKSVMEGNPVTVMEAYRRAFRFTGPVAIAVLIALLVLVPLVLLTILVPFAIWYAVRGHFFMQSMVFGHSSTPRGSFRQSFRTVKGHWWKIGFSLLVFDLLAVLPGILIGFGLLTIGRTAVGFANGISSLLYALLIPLSVLSVTILYLTYLKDPNQEDQKMVAEVERIRNESDDSAADVAPATAPTA